MRTTDYSRLVLDSLKKHDIIDNELYEKCIGYGKSYSHKPHLQSLPYDLNTNDLSKLEERVMATSREMLRTANQILNTTSELSDAISYVENNDEDCKSSMESAKNSLTRLKSELNEYDGDYEDTTKHLQELCEEYENIMPRIFSKYEKYLKKDNSERIKESIINDESNLRDLASKFSQISHYNAPFPASYLTDNSTIVKLSNNISNQTIGAISNHEHSLNQQEFIKQRIKDRDVLIRELNDYESHLDRISEKLEKLPNLTSDETDRVEYMNRLIQQSKEDYHIDG